MKKVNFPFKMFKLAANTNDNQPQKMQNPEEMESKYVRGQMLVLLGPPNQLTVLVESKAETCEDNIHFVFVEWRPSSLLPAQRVC